MLDPRIYRAAFLPALLALIVGAFSIGNRPRPAKTPLAADAFDELRAATTLRDLARRFPSRAPGSSGDRGLAGAVAGALRSDDFTVRVHDLTGETIDGERSLQTVVGVRAGFSTRRIVVVAHRDAASSPATAELSGTAALLELARVFSGRRLNKTLVFVSTSGGSGGAAGLRDYATRFAARTDAMLVLGDLAGNGERRPQVVPWSDGGPPAPVRLQRTVEDAVREEVGKGPGGARTFSQFARLAFPLTLSEQGAAGALGLPAVLLQVSGERGPGGAITFSPRRLRNYGRAALRSITALDGSPGSVGHPKADLIARKHVIPGWAVSLLVGALLLPVALAVVDAFARARRRRERVGMWIWWVLAGAVPFALTAGFVKLIALIGLVSASPMAPVSPDALPPRAGGAAALAATALVLLLGWIGVRPMLLRALGVRGKLSRAGAATATAVIGCAVVVVVWIANAFAAAVLLVALHAWMLVLLSEERPSRGVRIGALVAGLLPPAFVVLYYADVMGFGPLDTLWNAFLVVASSRLGLGDVVVWSLLLACLAAVVAILRAVPSPAAPPPVTVRGPATYAGPGSLGGTRSALRR